MEISCMAQETQTRPLYQPRGVGWGGIWEGGSNGRGYMYTYWRKKWQPTPVLLPGKSQGGRSLVGYSPWGRKELNTTEYFHFHFHMYTYG